MLSSAKFARVNFTLAGRVNWLLLASSLAGLLFVLLGVALDSKRVASAEERRPKAMKGRKTELKRPQPPREASAAEIASGKGLNDLFRFILGPGRALKEGPRVSLKEETLKSINL